jgi:CubicO group peptidase (beta-lactamase class C family)
MPARGAGILLHLLIQSTRRRGWLFRAQAGESKYYPATNYCSVAAKAFASAAARLLVNVDRTWPCGLRSPKRTPNSDGCEPPQPALLDQEVACFLDSFVSWASRALEETSYRVAHSVSCSALAVSSQAMVPSSARRLVLLLVATIHFGAAAAQAQDLRARIDEYLAEQVQKRGIPGLTMTVVRDGRVIYSGAHGVRKLGGAEPLAPQSVFHLASVSKPFVATAIMQLVERGKLNLDDRVTRWLPYFRLADDRFGEVTIRQVLNHTSGMPDVEDYEWDRPQFDAGAAERYVRAMAGQRLLWAPGTRWQYSNMAFDALGDLIAKVSGVSFEAFVKTNVLEPLGMRNSSFIYPDIDVRLRTTGHVGNPARVSPVYPYNRRHAPSSTLNSNVIDMARWTLANLNRGQLEGRRILRPESYEALWTAAAQTSLNGARIGLSWFLGEHADRRTVFHAGGDTGFRSYVMLLPDHGIGLVLASNWEGTPRETLVRDVLDLVLASDVGVRK